MTMIRISTIIFIVLKLAKNQNIDVIPEPPAELTNIPPPPPEDIEVEAINFEDLRSTNETEKPKALDGRYIIFFKFDRLLFK